MKKLLLSLLVILLTIPAMAMFEPMPLDPNIRKGVLPNGLTYFILHNAEPRDQADFWMVMNVGSLQEQEHERGMAHIVEHMAFRALRHFPEGAVSSFLDGIGVGLMGGTLNAFAGIDRTGFHISSVPINLRPGVIDSVLLVLYDWTCASGLMLLDEEIELERGVIREEWRWGQSAQMRIFEQILPTIFGDNLYGHRLPIGTIEVIDNFTTDELRTFHRTWYRPDHQALVIVGDIDVDDIQRRIHERFGGIPTPTTPSPRITVPVEMNTEPLVAFGTDPEMTISQIAIEFKFEPMPREMQHSMMGLVMDYMTGLVTSMLNMRLSEISQRADAPFLFAGSRTGNFMLGVASTMNSFTTTAVSGEGRMKEALEAITVELARLGQHGFTFSELERAQATFMSNLERRYNERYTTRSVIHARQIANSFFEDLPLPGVAFEFQTMTQIAAMFPIEQLLPQLNTLVQGFISPENVVIYGIAPQREDLVHPTTDELLAVFTRTIGIAQEPFEDEALDEPLVATENLTPGRVVSRRNLDRFGENVTEFTLSNNVRVIIKPTDFRADEVLFVGRSVGGNSLFDDADFATFSVLGEVATIGGLGNFSRINLSRALAGKQATVTSIIGETTEQINGQGSPRDLETIMQLIYLHATSPRFDQDAFDSWFARQRTLLEGMAANPMLSFVDTITARTFGDQPRAQRMTPELLNQVNYQRAIELYKSRFACMGDFTFTFVGNIDEATFIPLMEQYLGALPNLNRQETYRDVTPRPLAGTIQAHFEREVQTAQASVVTTLTGTLDYTPENRMKFTMLQQMLRLVLFREIREDEGGTYGVSVQLTLNRQPAGSYSLQIFFNTANHLAEHLLAIAYREMERIAAEGPSQDDFDAAIATLVRTTEDQRRLNGAWLGAINEYATFQTEIFTNREALFNAVTPADIQNLMRSILNQQNITEVIMFGVEPVVVEEVVEVETGRRGRRARR